jgi:hypothetical protein
MRAGEWQCKGVNAAEPRAKVQRCDRKRHNSRGAPWGNRSATEGRAGARGQGDMGTRGRYEGMRAGGHEGWMGPASGFWRLKAERLAPERPTTVAVTRHLE